MRTSKQVLSTVLLIVTGMNALSAISYLYFVEDGSHYIAGGITLIACIMAFSFAFLARKRGKKELLLPGAAAMVISMVLVEVTAFSICCAVLFLLAYWQMKDESRNLLPQSAMILYFIMFLFQAFQEASFYAAAGDRLQEEVLPATALEQILYSLTLILPVIGIVFLIQGIRKKREAGIKFGAVFYIAGEGLLMVLSTFFVEEFMLMAVVVSFFWIFTSPALLLSLFFLSPKVRCISI